MSNLDRSGLLRIGRPPQQVLLCGSLPPFSVVGCGLLELNPIDSLGPDGRDDQDPLRNSTNFLFAKLAVLSRDPGRPTIVEWQLVSMLR